MSTLKKLLVAATLAAGLGTAGAASAAPGLNGNLGLDTASKGDPAVQQVYYGCFPVYRWVYTYYGWQQVYVGQRCPSYNPYYYGSPNIRFNIRF